MVNNQPSLYCPDTFEVIDFGRSFLLGANNKQSMVSISEQFFDGNVEQRKTLLDVMRTQGLDKTRMRFVEMCSNPG